MPESINMNTRRKGYGRELEVENKGTYSIIFIMDKFGFHVTFPDSSISFIEEKGDKKDDHREKH